MELSVADKHSAIGPCLPPGFKRSHDDDDEQIDNKKLKTVSIGPALPPGFVQPNTPSSDSDDDVIGPVLPTAGDSDSYSAAVDIDRRARKMRQKLLNEDDAEEPRGRETWMTQLPQQHELARVAKMPVAKTRLGEGRPEIDHSWTQMPGDKPQASQAKDKKHEEDVPSQRDTEMAAVVAQYDKSRREASLLELHQKKLDKKKRKKDKKEKKKKKKREKEKDKKKCETEERRPFDRDLDLKANVFDDAKKKALIKKSQILNTRFGHGSTQFL